MSSPTIIPKEIKSRLRNLPPLPAVIQRLVALDMHSAGAFDEIVDAAESDPPLTSKLLGLANSAGYAPETDITSIRQAVSRIGAKRLSELIVTMVLNQTFDPKSIDEKALWSHSILTAIAARHIALHSAHGVDPQLAYMCGLLHDIGRFVFFDGVPAEVQRADEFGWTSATGLLHAELDSVGIDHTEIGWFAAEHLGLPSNVGLTIRHHHFMGEPESLPAGLDRPLLTTVQTAEFIAALLQSTPSPIEMEPDQVIPFLTSRGEHLEQSLVELELTDIARLLPEIASEGSKLSDSFG